MSNFMINASEKEFNEIFDCYSDALLLKANAKTKDGDKLIKLDEWFQNIFPSIINSRSKPHLKHKEMIDLMKWKLLRGKMRPRLIEFVTSNGKEFVESTTEQGIKFANKGNIKSAIESISKLKGVGPATASAVLTAAVPGKCGFFADEVAAATPGLSNIKYNIGEYLVLNQTLIDCATRLNNDSKEEEIWNPHKVELAVWTHHILNKFNKLPSSVQPSKKKKI